ncbi:MAG TPA: hypothetical protein VK524_24830 [Polyangiaceae bacterium]|nr:hypothetical protein [Polyangiaceae bacterium]
MDVVPDASFSGYRVFLDDSLPEVAEALRQRLGELVRVAGTDRARSLRGRGTHARQAGPPAIATPISCDVDSSSSAPRSSSRRYSSAKRRAA